MSWSLNMKIVYDKNPAFVVNQAILQRKINQERSLPKGWIFSWEILTYCFLPMIILITLSYLVDNISLYVIFGQVALGVSTYFSLMLLRRWPLIDPIQFVVFLFHWWFAVGPSASCIFAWLRGDYSHIEFLLTNGSEALWVVAIGLPLYVFAARIILKFWPNNWYAKFLIPDGDLYRPLTIISYFTVGALVSFILWIFSLAGVDAFQSVNYLGGTISNNWALSAIARIGDLSTFATIGLLGYICGPKSVKNRTFKILAYSLILINTIKALTSGWKGAMVILFFWICLIFISWRKKLPWVLIIVLGLLYFCFVEPVVSYARVQAEVQNVTTPAERVVVFREVVKNYNFKDININRINIDSAFRGIYYFAGTIAHRSDLVSGPWKGTTLESLTALVPRVLMPTKLDINQGNFFARDLGVSDSDNYINNIGVSIPFEIVGNSGYIAGCFSFFVIGLLWTIFNVLLLSPKRLATHPLMPLFVFYTMGMEASIQQFLVKLRDLPLLLLAAWGIWLFLKKRL
jgi:hypothetical protein